MTRRSDRPMTPAAGRALLVALAVPTLAVAVGGMAVAVVQYPYSAVLAVLTAATAIAPLARQYRLGSLDAFSPLAYVVWFFVIPTFAVSGALVAYGWTPDWWLTLIPTPAKTFALTQAYLTLGVLAVSAGYLLPWPQRAGQRISRALPTWAWSPREVLLPGCLLLAIGVGLTMYAFSLGVIGFQRGLFLDSLSVTTYYFAQSLMFAAVLLWGAVFRGGLSRSATIVVTVLLVALIPFQSVLSGSRATALNHVIAMGFAFNYSGRAIRVRHVLAFGVLFVAALGAGMLYATTFRAEKTTAALETAAAPAQAEAPAPVVVPPPSAAPPPSAPPPSEPPPSSTQSSAQVPAAASAYVSPGEAAASLSEQGALAARVTDIVAERGVRGNVALVMEQVARRLDHVTSVATIVGNYERLRPEEDRRGVSGNIWRWTWTAFVPRVLWPNKPTVGDSRVLGELYIGFGGSSPAITPVADLLRNFGPVGIALGMFVLGIAMRLLHASLMSDAVPALWRTVVYYAVLMRISFEGFYGTLLPDAIRAAFVAVLVCGLVEGVRRAAKWRMTPRAGM